MKKINPKKDLEKVKKLKLFNEETSDDFLMEIENELKKSIEESKNIINNNKTKLSNKNYKSLLKIYSEDLNFYFT